MKQNKVKMTPDIVPEGFTLSLVLADALPVFFFGGSMILSSLLLRSPLFLLGAVLCLAAGAAKVLWKLVVVLRRKNIWALFIQMRILMPIGFLLMALALGLRAGSLNAAQMLSAALAFPAGVCFGVGALGMALMLVFAFALDSSDVRANWIEQLTNGAAQAAFFLGLLSILAKG